MALLWAAGIVWLAVDIDGAGDSSSQTAANSAGENRSNADADAAVMALGL